MAKPSRGTGEAAASQDAAAVAGDSQSEPGAAPDVAETLDASTLPEAGAAADAAPPPDPEIETSATTQVSLTDAEMSPVKNETGGPGMIKVRAITTMFHNAEAKFAGQEFFMLDADALDRVARAEVELV